MIKTIKNEIYPIRFNGEMKRLKCKERKRELRKIQ